MNKYRNVKTVVDNITFDSKKEAARYDYLKVLFRCRQITDFELQKVYELKVNGIKICNYRADFYYKDEDGKEVIEDTKGMKTPAYKLKAKLMLAIYGIRIIET